MNKASLCYWSAILTWSRCLIQMVKLEAYRYVEGQWRGGLNR